MSNNPKKDTDKEYIRLGLRIIGDFGATLAVPVVVFVLIGQWLDNKYHHDWLILLIFQYALIIEYICLVIHWCYQFVY